MMREHLRLGALGEHLAIVYLRNHDYYILSGNYATATGEIDIVAEGDGCLCFIEVKTRRPGGMLPPSYAVDEEKEENIKSTAAYFRSKYEFDLPSRFDIVEVEIASADKYVINPIKNAF